MKLPKTVSICGKTYKVILDKTTNGGWFCIATQTICIGTKNKNEFINITFLHELAEIALVERALRYKKPYEGDDNGNYLFVLNHQEFDNFIVDLYAVLKNLLK